MPKFLAALTAAVWLLQCKIIYSLAESGTADREIAALRSSVSTLKEEKKEQLLGKLFHKLYVK